MSDLPILSDERLAELARLERLALPAPWTAMHPGQCCSAACIDEPEAHGLDTADARFIAEARNALPAVLYDLQRMRAAAEAVEALHAPDPERMTRDWDTLGQDLGPACSHCIDCSSCGVESVYWPCLTIRTLRGETP